MSRETSKWLNQNTLVGFSSKRGTAWHYRAADQSNTPFALYPSADRIVASNGEEYASNHYPSSIPTQDVVDRLFYWDAIPVTLGFNRQDVVAAAPSEFVKLTDFMTYLRSDTHEVLGKRTFTASHVAHSYGEWLVSKVQEYSGLEVGSAGLLKNGAVAWVSFEVPETLSTTEGVSYRPQLLACTSFDGSLATTYKRVTTLVVCDNTLASALGEKNNVVKIKHSKYSHLRTDHFDALGLISEDAAQFADTIAQLTQWEVSDAEWCRFLDQYVPVPADKGKSKTMAEDKRDILSTLYGSDDRSATWKGTAFGVLQACNTWFHHNQIVRGAQRAERNMLNVLGDKTQDHDELVLKTLATVTG